MAELIQIFYQPGKVFEFVRERRAWVFALLANILLAVGFTVVMYQEIGATNMARTNIEGSSRAKSLTPEEIDRQVAVADTPLVKGITYGSVAIGTGVVMVISALLYMAIAGMSGGPIKFTQALGAASYATWPFTVITVLFSCLVIFISSDRAGLDAQHLLATNVGAFLDKATTGKALFSLASSIDVLILGQSAFAAWGLAIVAKIPFGRALGGMLAIWALWTVVKMGLALVF